MTWASQARADSTDRDTRSGWPAYFKGILLEDLQGLDAGKAIRIRKGYVFHRLDMEKIALRARELEACKTDLEASRPKPPGFWDSLAGRYTIAALAFGLGAAAGVSLSVLIYRAAK